MISRSRLVPAAVLLAVGLGTLAACGGDRLEGTLVVTRTPWCGECENPGSGDPETTRVAIREGAVVDGGVTITITDVSDDDVTISTSETVAPRGETGGISLTDTEDEFEVTPGASTRFATATMDAGTNYEVSIEPSGSE